MTTTRQPSTETPHHASYAAMRARLDEQIEREKQAGATLADPTWEVPRCTLGHADTRRALMSKTFPAGQFTCPTCCAERGLPWKK